MPLPDVARWSVKFCLLVLASLYASVDNASAQGSVALDRAALEALYNATGGPSWTVNTNWLTDAPLSHWAGVVVDGDGRVTELDLDANNRGGLQGSGSGNNLMGSIPAELGQLTKLNQLFLGGNELTGPIPPALGNLVNLTWLSLSNNRLSGFIPPALENLVNLQRLQLDRNQLSGPIPAELGALTNLVGLNLLGNQLNGMLPEELGALTNLSFLNVQINQLSGPIPAAWGNLTDLGALILSYNNLSGPIPAHLANLTSLNSLGIDSNTGLCLAPDFPVAAEFARLAQERGVPVCNGSGGGLLWTDQRIAPGVTPVRAVHLMELRRQVDAARVRCGLEDVAWIDPQIRPGVTPIKAIHITQLRAAINAATQACGQMRSAWTDPRIVPGVTHVKAVHVTELRDAVLALNDGSGANQAPEPIGAIPTQTLTAGGDARRVDVAPYFRDPDDDPLTYSAISASPGIVAASVSGSIVTLTPVTAGTTTVGVTASDSSMSGIQTIAVTVDPEDTHPFPTGKQVTLSDVAFQHTRDGRDGRYHGSYHIAGSVANTGSEDIDSYRIYYRFYRGDGTLLHEEYITQLFGPNVGESQELPQPILESYRRDDLLGWDYFLIEFQERRVVIPCTGCETLYPAPPAGPCGIPFSEGVLASWQCTSGRWVASGPVQEQILCERTEEEALEYSTLADVGELELIGTADYRRRSGALTTGARIWRERHGLASYSYDLRGQLSNVSCY